MIPLRAQLDESGLPRKNPTTTESGPAALRPSTTTPCQGDPAIYSGAVTVTADENRVIFERLAPYLPPYLRKVENHPSGWGLRFEFAAFTGREDEPSVPGAFYRDPQLSYVPKSESYEDRLRRAARVIIGDIYEEARKQWKDAAYVAALRQVVLDAPDRWRAYERETKALESAYAYLRTPAAAQEWPAAVSRLVDAQDRTRAAAAEFDRRAVNIAFVHKDFLYADLTHGAALAKAGYPEAKDWHIGDAFDGYFTGGLTTHVDRQIEEQEAHLSQVSRLAGLPV